MKPPIFIVGCPRSGTQLLADLLRPTEYGVPFESHFILKYGRRLHRYGNLGDYANFSRLVRHVLNHWAVAMWDLSIDPHDLFTELPEKTYVNIVNSLCAGIAKKISPAATSWGDKTPFYALELETLLSLFPGSKAIYVTRDGRDVAASLLHQSWGPRNVYSCALLWKQYVASKEKFSSLRTQEKLYEMKYEALLQDPEFTVSHVYDFIDQEYDKETMIPLLAKININNYNKWKTELSDQQVACFESVAGNELVQERYQLGFQAPIKIHRPQVIYYKAHNSLGQAFQLLRRNTIGALQIKLSRRKPFEL